MSNRDRRHSGILLSRLLRDEAGVAMAMVALLGTALVMTAMVLVIRATSQHTAVDVDRDWEQAIHIAEGGVDGVLYSIGEGLTVNKAPAGTPLDTRVEVVAAAAGFPAEAAPEGDVVTFVDDEERHIYSLAWTPSRDDPNAKVRVVRSEYEVRQAGALIPGWSAEYALLSGGDVIISGNAKVNGSGANVHANGSLIGDWFDIEGCGSESIGSGYDPGPGCPAGPAPAVPVPIIDPLMAYPMSMFDMCPDGQAHAGPAHPVAPNLTGIPCGGAVVPGKQGMNPTGDGWANTDKNTPAGVYYVIGDFDGRVGFRNDLEVTIITAKDASLDSVMDCAVPGGNIWVSSQSSTVGHPSAGGLTLVAAGDVVFRGGADIVGLVLAHEQIDYKGNSSLTGAVIAESACDSPGSPVAVTTILSGTADIFWNGPISTPFEAFDPEAGEDEVVLGRRIEL